MVYLNFYSLLANFKRGKRKVKEIQITFFIIKGFFLNVIKCACNAAVRSYDRRQHFQNKLTNPKDRLVVGIRTGSLQSDTRLTRRMNDHVSISVVK